MEAEIKELKDHYIICEPGSGSHGNQVLKDSAVKFV
jgi:hypothetical protein